MSAALPYKGEGTCMLCNDKVAYYVSKGKAACGYCTKKHERKALVANPAAGKLKEERIAKHAVSVEQQQQRNGARGDLICSKMTMFQGQQPEFIDGYLNVFPNFKHGGRKDGLGLPSLSPKSLGPVEHPQPDLPPAKNLENFHQFSKLFPEETMEEFRRAQKNAFNDPEPHRHKPQALKNKTANKNIPKCWIWTRADGTVVEYSYIGCRQFYCNYFERLVLQEPDYDRLSKLLQNGTNIRICGYDGHHVDEQRPIKDYYLDHTRPFGHEMVLYTMLKHDPATWPWRALKTEDF